MTMKRLFLLAAVSLFACSSANEDNAVTGEEEELVAGACSITDGSTNRKMATTARAKLDDPFFKLVLAGGSGKKCPLTTKDAIARVEEETKSSMKSFVVSERGDQPTNEKTGYRFIGVPTVDGKSDVLFLSMLGSKAGVSQDFLEVMALSTTRPGAWIYYALEGGKWTMVGDGSTVVPGEPPKFRCAGCHTTGSPLMKELQDSWNNWNSIWFSMPDPGSQEETFKKLFSSKSGAENLEKFFFTSIKAHAKSYVERELAKTGGLKKVLKHVMCEIGEPNLVTSHNRHSTRFGTVAASSFMNFPPSILVSQLLKAGPKQGGYSGVVNMNLPAMSSLALNGTSYSKALQTIGSKVGGEAGDTMFGLSFPERGFMDNMVVEELVAKGILDKDLLTDLMMTDFTVPAYSKVRCDLAATAPDKGATAEEVRTAWAANLKTSTLKGAKELEARLTDKADFTKHETAVETFLKACNTRNTSEADAYALDIVKLASQRRKEFSAIYGQLIESEDLIPSDTLTDTKPNAFRLNATTCKLEAQ
jgi:hypothetical protein